MGVVQNRVGGTMVGRRGRRRVAAVGRHWAMGKREAQVGVSGGVIGGEAIKIVIACAGAQARPPIF